MDQWLALLVKIKNLQVPRKVENILTARRMLLPLQGLFSMEMVTKLFINLLNNCISCQDYVVPVSVSGFQGVSASKRSFVPACSAELYPHG
jgi:hypothetical protein